MSAHTHQQAGRTAGGLVERLTALAAGTGFGPEAVKGLLEEFLADGADWLAPQYLRRPPDQPWVLSPLYRAPDRRCSMLVAVFGPGQLAPVHDHGSWAVIGIYRGREQETWFRPADDGSTPGRVRLDEDRSFVNETGTAHVVPDATIHTVEALDGVDAVSIHVYGTDIVTQERSAYDLDTGRVSPYAPPVTEPRT